jgi:hypothetical protein
LSVTINDYEGSERITRSGVTDDRLREAQNINKSLTALGHVISCLATEESHIPYRNNKLTLLMSDSLGGNAKTLMFVCVSPTNTNVEESLNSLTYATRARSVVNNATKNVTSAAKNEDMTIKEESSSLVDSLSLELEEEKQMRADAENQLRHAQNRLELLEKQHSRDDKKSIESYQTVNSYKAADPHKTEPYKASQEVGIKPLIIEDKKPLFTQNTDKPMVVTPTVTITPVPKTTSVPNATVYSNSTSVPVASTPSVPPQITVTTPAISTPAPSTPVSTSQGSACSKCGKTSAGRFCIYCGSPLKSAPESSSTAQSAKTATKGHEEESVLADLPTSSTERVNLKSL